MTERPAFRSAFAPRPTFDNDVYRSAKAKAEEAERCARMLFRRSEMVVAA